MITGGEEEEFKRIRRADRRMIRDAILGAAANALQENRQTLTGDVVNALKQFAINPKISESRRTRAEEMADAMGLFCDGFEGELFNRPGELWPEVDVTLIDLATLAREGYNAQLAVAYTSIMMTVNNTAERYQHQKRPLVMLTDEGHIVTTNALLAPFIVKIVKMWRKLGAWYWVATQNMEDFPNTARKMLNMIEWWIMLVPPDDEIDQLSRFFTLDDDRKNMLKSAKKLDKCYVEGIVLSQKLEAIFRNVPPSICLALAMTEKHQKAERSELMRQHGIREVDAAKIVAKNLDQLRGIAA